MKIYILLFLITLTTSCPNKDEYCVACSGTNCVDCFNSYLNKTGKCIPPVKKVENCIKYKSDGVCSLCKFGFYLNTSGKCSEISIKDCLKLDSSTSCKMCKNGILPENKKCEDSEKKCKIENCNLCTSSNNRESCFVCDGGYTIFINGGITFCVEEKDYKTDNCHYINPIDTSQCAICNPNYYWSEAKCVKAVEYEIDIGYSGFKILKGFFCLFSIFVIV